MMALTPVAMANYWQCESEFTFADKKYYGNCQPVTCPPCAPCSNGTCGVCENVECPQCPQCICVCPEPQCPPQRGPWIDSTNHYYGFTVFQVVTAFLVVLIVTCSAGLVWYPTKHVIQLNTQPVTLRGASIPEQKTIPLPPLMASNLQPGMCQHIKGNGEQCKLPQFRGSDYCWRHK